MRRPAPRVIAGRLLRSALPSGRSVLHLPDWAGFGNQLFYYLHASVERQRGEDVWVVPSPRGGWWLDRFPTLRELTLDPAQVAARDTRVVADWVEITRFGESFTPGQLAAFIDRHLQPVLGVRPTDAVDDLVVNLRRREYFSDPTVRGLLSFDQIAYLEVALATARRQRGGEAWRRITVVSDDADWCGARLGHLAAQCSALDIRPGGDPIGDLRTVASARSLVIVNSTFSQWAAHVSGHVHGDNHALIHVPAFASRPFDGSPPKSIDPRWTVIEDIPGGWDS